VARITDPKPSPAFGFLTVVEYPEHGLVGGYLVLNQSGRPLEFHCTAPIKPNRAQQILYGPTLESYLFGEQIGRALLSKSSVEPVVIWTDREQALAVREFVDVPVGLVMPANTGTGAGDDGVVAGEESRPVPASSPTAPAIGHAPPVTVPAVFRLGRNRLAVSPLAAADRESIADRLGDLAETFDLAEPFERIREAIEEARRGGQSAEGRAQRAA
jgi:hypothetical protein